MKSFYWLVLIILGIVIIYTPKLNVSFSISLGMAVLVIGILGLVKNLLS